MKGTTTAATTKIRGKLKCDGWEGLQGSVDS